MKREFSVLAGGGLLLAALIFGLGWQNLSAPGLFYDEAIYGGLTKDFVTGHASGGHMPNVSNTEIFGAPFPVFVQPYLGALKCWLLIPIFKIFGATLAVLRASNLFLCVMALFIFMGWTWRLLGLAEALLAGLLLAMDPAFFFPSVLDWGSLLPSLLCRFAGFFLVLLAWRRQQTGWALLAGLALGLGFFNKIDFAILLAGAGAAAICAYGSLLKTLTHERWILILAAGLGFTIGGGLMFLRLPFIFYSLLSSGGPSTHGGPGELPEKLDTLRAMYDGSYFYRLMDAGGVFGKMYQTASPVWTPFGTIFVIAILILTADVFFSAKPGLARRAKIFLLLSSAFITLGVLILPGAVRIHHTTLVYPFPYLIIAAAAMALWRYPCNIIWQRQILRGLPVAGLMTLVIFEFSAISHTEKLIRETGGRGWWSGALAKFAGEIQNHSGLVVSSLDWGFNEQLEFLTAGPQLKEPFWQAEFGGQPELPCDPNHIYLVHPPEFALAPFGAQFMESISRENKNAIVQPWRDEQGKIAFYTIRFNPP